jgi:hypothetical protein
MPAGRPRELYAAPQPTSSVVSYRGTPRRDRRRNLCLLDVLIRQRAALPKFCKITRPNPWRRFADTPPQATAQDVEHRLAEKAAYIRIAQTVYGDDLTLDQIEGAWAETAAEVRQNTPPSLHYILKGFAERLAVL